MKKTFEKVKNVTRKTLEHKPHLEFISGILTIPVLITAILLNLNNLRSKPAATPTPTPIQNQKPATIYQQTPVTSVQKATSPQPTTNPNQCIKGIGPIDITYPQEGQTINNTNPLCIDISYNGDNYCAVVWAYKINGGSLSDYSNNSVCLYNLPAGNNTFSLQVKSLVSNSVKTIERHFNYVAPTPAPTSTTSASSSATNQ
jgi:hypothetical protein